MNKTDILLILALPIGTFLGGFLAARQLRPLENVPWIATLFVQRKWLFSIVMGFLASVVLTLTLSLATEFLATRLLILAGSFLLAALGSYLGVAWGWGRAPSIESEPASPEQVQIDQLRENVSVENTLASIRITINTQKRWLWFAMSLFQWLFIGLCTLPILGLVVISALQDYLPQNMNIPIWLMVTALVLYLMYTKFQEALEYIFDREVIEIDNLSVKIEKSGSVFRSKKEYPADSIKKITTMFSLGGANIGMRPSPYVNSNIPAFMLWHNRGLKWYRSFGRAIDLVDAQTILENIYRKFPQYKG